MSSQQEYFVPGFGISRQVMFSHIQFYLGPYASVRPYSYQGREGYLVTAPGQPLTKNQIEDLQNLSRQYEEQAAQRMSMSASYGSTSSSSNDAEPSYINRPVPVTQRDRRRYSPSEGSRRSR